MGVTEQSDSLTVADHTHLVKAVLDYPLHVIRHLQPSGGSTPTPLQVLDAALKVRIFDAETKSRLRRVREKYPAVEAGMEGLSTAHRDALDRLKGEIEGKPIEEKIEIVARERSTQDGDATLAAGLELAEQILRDGADSIYSPDYPAAELFEEPASDSAADTATADAIGAAVGALLLGVPGGVAAGAGASISHVVLAVRELPLG